MKSMRLLYIYNIYIKTHVLVTLYNTCMLARMLVILVWCMYCIWSCGSNNFFSLYTVALIFLSSCLHEYVQWGWMFSVSRVFRHRRVFKWLHQLFPHNFQKLLHQLKISWHTQYIQVIHLNYKLEYIHKKPLPSITTWQNLLLVQVYITSKQYLWQLLLAHFKD